MKPKERKVSDLTVTELEDLIEMVVDRLLTERFGDPNAGLELTDWIKQRLRENEAARARGEPLIPHEEVMRKLGLK